jgi:cytochrome c-type biogenesis protein CcmH
MKVLVVLPVLFLVACNDHQKPPEDVPLAPRAMPAAAPTPGQPILSGTITIDDALKDKVPANATLFIVARAEGGGGPPALVKKVAGVSYPYTFALEAGDVMMQGAPIPDKLVLTARVDQDGDAMSRSPGDLMGMVKVPVERNATGIALTVDQAIGAPQ